MHKLAQFVDGGGHRFVDKNRKPRLDEGTGAADVIRAVVGGDDDSIDMADHVLWLGDDVGDEAGGGDERCLCGKIRPNMGDAGTGHTHGLKRLTAEVGGNRGVGALGHFCGIVAIDDGGPGVRVAVALDHAQHGKADFRV